MCGIAGIASLKGQPVGQDELEAMCSALVHRGPDDVGYYLDKGIGLGHRRLSIIDLESGRQPIGNEDGSVQVVLNGEIYNYRELRAELQRKGHVFATRTDTEVIVHLYEEHGPDCVRRLRGMFAFALWDGRRRRLMLARDRIGIKPLYYGQFGGRVAFASELKGLLQLDEVARELDYGAVSNLFSYLTTPRTRSVVKGACKLPPAHYLLVGPDTPLAIERYWDLVFEPDRSRSKAETIERLREVLADAVESHRVSDVPVGAFLSGGLDSSAVVALLAEKSASPVSTFSIGFEEQDYDESHHARRVAEHLGTDHHELILRPDVMSLMDDLAWDLDEPFGDSSAIPTYMVSRLAGEHVKVVLSGDGGDELFAGYDKYLVEERERRLFGNIPAPLRKMMGMVGQRMRPGQKGRNFLRHIALDGAERYMDAATMVSNDEMRQLFSPELMADTGRETRDDHEEELARHFDEMDWLSAVQYLDFQHYLPQDILTKVDRMSMAHSIETRVPLLDHHVMEFAATIPPDMKLHHGETKHIFKEAMAAYLPADIVRRKKQGFAVPLGHWFGGHLNDYLRDLLLSSRTRQRGIFNPEYVERLIALHRQGRPIDLELWTLASFELWCRRFLDEAAPCVAQPARLSATG